MGIPSYFVHIVKNYPNIIKKFIHNQIIIHNLYIDSNSIIYDAIKTLPYDSKMTNYEKNVNSWVCDKLKHYILTIQPSNKVYIAFDGVSPIAKLEQQRTRRYKTWLTNDYLNKLNDSKKEIWDTTAITPGSEFMKNLSKYIKEYFIKDFPNLEIIISSSEVYGEGEHKIYQYMRDNNNYHNNTNTVIYGLDADLIMLSLIHLNISPNIYLYRETPHFISSINQNLKPNELYLLDIYELDEYLNIVMHNNPKLNTTLDYIFICFLLGNDFMPHFPALNIRTHGIQIILDCYRKLFNNKEKLIKNNKIQWHNLRKLINELSKTEEELCIIESKKRNKLAKTLTMKFGNKSSEESFQSTPIIDRTIENYINIGDDGWQFRYYKELFDIEIDDIRRKEICINYLEGLEWNFKYYTTGCPDWNWHYKYKYPPLLEDLYKYIPQFDTEFITNNNSKPIDPLVQLAYVLPRNSLYLLPANIYKNLIEQYGENYRLDYKIIWSYCRYMWEAHIDLPNINIDKLKIICNK